MLSHNPQKYTDNHGTKPIKTAIFTEETGEEKERNTENPYIQTPAPRHHIRFLRAAFSAWRPSSAVARRRSARSARGSGAAARRRARAVASQGPWRCQVSWSLKYVVI